jgi:hypothetical protein
VSLFPSYACGFIESDLVGDKAEADDDDKVVVVAEVERFSRFLPTASLLPIVSSELSESDRLDVAFLLTLALGLKNDVIILMHERRIERVVEEGERVMVVVVFCRF